MISVNISRFNKLVRNGWVCLGLGVDGEMKDGESMS
jgi:hypothetical protein